VVFVYLDAIALRVRIANRVVSAPVLVAMGVKADGQKAVLDLELCRASRVSAGVVDLSRGWLAVGSSGHAL
jgi:transposase-like protein